MTTSVLMSWSGCATLFLLHHVSSSQERSNLPEPVKYFNVNNNIAHSKDPRADISPHEGRLGLNIGYGNDLQGFSGPGTISTYTPLKVDLGGLVLGTLIGLGAVIIAPKLLHIFSHHGGEYARSETTAEGGELTNILSQLDQALHENHIDPASCLQRAVCTAVQSMESTKMISNFTSSNALINFLIEGSKLKTAMDRGINGESCSVVFPHCTLKN